LQSTRAFAPTLSASNTARSCKAIIEGHFAARTSDDVRNELEKASIANARLNSIEEFLTHPQILARNRTREIRSPAGPLTTYLPALTIDSVDPVMGSVPGLGEHTDQILVEIGEAIADEPGQ
jgi:crotonobetainyl-CoA:carnitine CoA-transferase CaiB-like acyl-CoA transferase